MGWLSVVLTLAAIILVLLQGISLFWRSREEHEKTAPLLVVIGQRFVYLFLAVRKVTAPHASAGGVLNLLLATGGLVAFLLFHNGALIASSEYGVLLVQGPAARVAVYCMLIMISLAAGMVWQTARLYELYPKKPGHPALQAAYRDFAWISLVGVAIGIAAAFQVRSVNPDDPTAFCIRFYDMWWPPLLLWSMICLSQWTAITIGVKAWWARLMWGLFFATGAAFIPVYRSLKGLQYAIPSSEPFWKIVLWFGVPACMASSAMVLLARRRRWTAATFTALAGVLGVASMLLWMDRYRSFPWIFKPWPLWASCVAIFALDSIPRWGSGELALLKRKPDDPIPSNHDVHESLWTNIKPKVSQIGGYIHHEATGWGIADRAYLGYVILASAAIGWGVADLSYFAQLSRGWDFSLLILGWTILAVLSTRPSVERACPNHGTSELILPEDHPGEPPLQQNRSWFSHLLAIIALTAIGWGVADLTYHVQLDPSWDLSLLIFGWIIFLELIAEHPLADIGQRTGHETRAAGAWLLQGTMKVLGGVANHGSSSSGQEGSKAGSGGKLSWVLKLVLILIALTIIGEIPNRGKIIVQPFDALGTIDPDPSADRASAHGATEDAKKEEARLLLLLTTEDKHKRELGKAISDRIANTLALIGEEMRPDLLTLGAVSRPHDLQPELKPKKPWIPASNQEADGLQTTVGSSGLEIPGTNVRVPLGFLTLPIQAPMRRILGTEEIQGTIEGASNPYTMLATSSTGDAWRTQAERSKGIWSLPAKFLQERSHECSTDKPDFKQKSTVVAPPVATDESNPADALAYMIVTSDDRLLQLGMAQSWRAVQPFLQGMAAWKRFDQTRDYEFLTVSIERFRSAICKDPNFALAYYRLGRALTADGQPAAAADAFRASLKANPNFVAGHIALANLLYDFDDSYYMPGAEVHKQPSVTTDEKCRNREEAMSLWRRVIQDLPNEASVADQATAYAGMCHSIMAQAEQELNEAKPKSSSQYDEWACRSSDAQSQQNPEWIGSHDQESRYAALFYCKRAEILYSRLPFVLRRDEQVRDARASALTQIGEILDRTPAAGPDSARSLKPPQPKKADDWSCEVGEIPQDGITKKVEWLARPKHAYTTFAQAYYEQAKVIQPDDWKAHCYFAISSQALGHDHDQPMKKLEANSSMHNVAGNAWWRSAGLARKPEEKEEQARRYTMALVEFKRAIDLFPEDVRSLNDFAYTVWQWHLTSHLSVEELQREFEREFELEFKQRFKGWQPEKELSDGDQEAKNIDELAEHYARKAVALTLHSDIQRSFTMRSTLQEVILAEAYWGKHKPQEALTTLQLKGKDAIPAHTYFDELRWDLAQAELCTSAGRGAEQEAKELLSAIKHNEANREVQPYTDADKNEGLLATKCQLKHKSPNQTATSAVARKSHGAKPGKKQLPNQMAVDRPKPVSKQSL